MGFFNGLSPEEEKIIEIYRSDRRTLLEYLQNSSIIDRLLQICNQYPNILNEVELVRQQGKDNVLAILNSLMTITPNISENRANDFMSILDIQ